MTSKTFYYEQADIESNLQRKGFVEVGINTWQDDEYKVIVEPFFRNVVKVIATKLQE